MHPLNFPRLAHLALVLLLALPAAWCAAQEKPAAERPARTEYHLISIDFPGGPFSKLVASLNKEELSIIQSAGLDPVLPAFSVKNAPISSVIVALGRLIEPQGYVLDVTGPNVAVLMSRPENRRRGFASFQIEGKIGPRATEEVIAAIQQGCEFAHEGRPSTLRFKFHPGTKLLFVSGSEQDIEVAHQVYASLPNVAVPKEPIATPPPEKK